MQVNPIQHRGYIISQQTSFQGKHLPRTFSAMMNYIYKNTPMDTFETDSIMHVSTILEDGREVNGMVIFTNGRYSGLVMDEGDEKYKQMFMRTALMRYKKHIASRQVQEKLGYDKLA